LIVLHAFSAKLHVTQFTCEKSNKRWFNGERTTWSSGQKKHRKLPICSSTCVNRFTLKICLFWVYIRDVGRKICSGNTIKTYSHRVLINRKSARPLLEYRDRRSD